MKKFDVEITETLQRTVSVEAASQEEAEKIVTKAWNNEDYVLDSADFVGVDFKTVGEQELSESRKMEVLLVQPGMYPQKATIGTELKDFQDAVGGTIAASSPFDDGRMIEIYLLTSLAPIPFATVPNRETGHMGQNYFRSLFAVGFQGLLILVCVAIYAVLIQSIAADGDPIGAIWGCVGYTVLLCFTLFKTGSLAKSIFGCH